MLGGVDDAAAPAVVTRLNETTATAYLRVSFGHLVWPNVELTGAARLYRAASSDRRERG